MAPTGIDASYFIPGMVLGEDGSFNQSMLQYVAVMTAEPDTSTSFDRSSVASMAVRRPRIKIHGKNNPW